MKFSIFHQTLTDALVTCSTSIPKGIVMTSILQNYVFEEYNGHLVISAANMFSRVSVEIPEIEIQPQDFRVLFPPAAILNIAKRSGDVIDIDCSPRKAVISSSGAEWILSLEDATKFPEIPKVEDVTWVEVAREPFIDNCVAVRDAASTDAGNPALQVVNVQDNAYTASDGTSLIQVTSDFYCPPMDINVASLKDLINNLKKVNSETFKVCRGNNGLAFNFNNTTMTFLSGNVDYPDVGRILIRPAVLNDLEFFTEKEMLLNCIARVSITSGVYITLKLTKNLLTLTTKDANGSQSKESIEVKYDSDTVVNLNLRTSQLLKAVNSCPLQNLSFLVGESDATSLPSVLIKAPEAQYKAVLTQVRTDLL